MTSKHTLDFIKSEFQSANCTLLAKVYKDNRTRMSYICECGSEAKITYAKFKKGQRCEQCRRKKISVAHRFDFKSVNQYFTEHGCVLLAEEYKNSLTKMPYICSCGNSSEISYGSFQQGHKCRQCGIKRAEKNHLWNPDRDYIKTSRIISKRAGGMVQRCFKIFDKRKEDKTETLLGYSRKKLFEHITSHPNWGRVKDKEWHIDHIFPVVAFVECGITNLKIINALDNLQPLTAEDNFRKNDDYNKQEFIRYLKGKYGREI